MVLNLLFLNVILFIFTIRLYIGQKLIPMITLSLFIFLISFGWMITVKTRDDLGEGIKILGLCLYLFCIGFGFFISLFMQDPVWVHLFYVYSLVCTLVLIYKEDQNKMLIKN